MNELSPIRAAAFAKIALSHVAREYPHKPDHVMTGEGDLYRPRQLHPIFFGSFDWHSCVHGYWLLARIRRLFPHLAEVADIDAQFAATFTPENVAGECAYLRRPDARGFERPYGWAWLLMLQSELIVADMPWAETLRPLADVLAARWSEHLPLMTYPVRTGTHANTAFALVLTERYSRIADDRAMHAALVERARTWFGSDQAGDIREPSGEDFLSPTLMEALAMQRLLTQPDFRDWFAGFLPTLPRTLIAPARVSDRSDGRIAHLDGLNLSRAWAMRALAAAVGGPLAMQLEDLAADHFSAAIHEIQGDYMGEHWLASFALLACTGTD